jgi:hypothetical protein
VAARSWPPLATSGACKNSATKRVFPRARSQRGRLFRHGPPVGTISSTPQPPHCSSKFSSRRLG